MITFAPPRNGSSVPVSLRTTVRVTSVRADKPITELETRVLRDDGTVVLEGRAVCYTMPLPR